MSGGIGLSSVPQRLWQSALRPTAASYETFSRYSTFSTPGILTSQRLYLTAIELPVAKTFRSITFLSGGQALATGVNQVFGLFDADRVKLAETVDDTSTAWAASTIKTLNLTADFTTTYAGFYYLGILINATTTPQLITANLGQTTPLALAPIICGQSTATITALPATAAAITVAAWGPYAYVTEA